MQQPAAAAPTPTVSRLISAFGQSPVKLPTDRAIFAVGDVHGRLDLLLEIEAMIVECVESMGIERAIYVRLGDFIDRGPSSKGVVEHVRAGLRHPRIEEHNLIGNHEVVLLDLMLAGPGEESIVRQFERVGGLATLHSAGLVWSSDDVLAALNRRTLKWQVEQAFGSENIRFLGSTLQRYLIVDGFLFVHAGINPTRPLNEQRLADMTWIRDPFTQYAGKFERNLVVVHGHTIESHSFPVVRKNRISLDTGAYYSGVLSALHVQGDRMRFLQASSADPAPR